MKISSINVGMTNFAPTQKTNQNHVSPIIFTGKKDDDEKMMLALLALAGYGQSQVSGASKKEMEAKLDEIIKGKAPSQKTLSMAEGQVSDIKRNHSNPTLSKHGSYFHGVYLLEQKNVLNRNEGKYRRAIETIQNIGYEKLTSTKPLPPITKPNPTIWSITSEFAPIKEGGLGSVPPEIRNNAEKLGVNIPTFVPMYLNEGLSTFNQVGDKYTYLYKGRELPLEKMATVKMDVYKNGIPKSIPVSFFLHTDKDKEGNERQLVFVKADDYFDGTIYEANAKTEEPEKFAVFSKAVYEFAKLKMEGTKYPKDVVIENESALAQIKEPDAMILNDWQASPTAALMRYKAVMENAHKQLSDTTTQKLKDMSVITIGHNVKYQGSTQNHNDFYQKKAVTSNILNTLFDKYAYDVVSNADLKATSIDPKAKYFENVLLMNQDVEDDNFTNFLNMGIVLSDYFNPVSQNYVEELITPSKADLSRKLQWVLQQKNKAGKLVGIINGNDFDNLSIQAKLPQIKKTTNVDFKEYDKTQSSEAIQEARLENKTKLYNEFVLPFTESKASTPKDLARVNEVASELEFYRGTRGTTMPILTDEEIANTPFLMSGGRLVKQKGIDVLCDASKILLDNWEKDFPGKNKPIFFIAGADGEGGAQRKIIENFKNNQLSKEDSNRVLFAHGFAPMAALMAGSDYFLMPSNFEPCGLTQGESLALATPVIASAVGGIVDTVNRNGLRNGVLTDKEKPLTAEEYYKAMKEGLTIFFNDKDEYKQMVKDSIAEDFSWAKEGREGPVYDYLELLGIDRKTLPDA